jgi:hypothetical protein
MTNKEKYRLFCETEVNIPIFSKDWWLDSVCGFDNWDVILIEKNNQVIASLPFYKYKQRGFTYMGMPKFTPFLGTYFKYDDNLKHEKKLSIEKEYVNLLLEQLPKADYFGQFFHYKYTNWLPFYWRGYEQSTFYTYVIDDLSDLNKVFDNFSYSKKKNIKKAEKELSIKYDLSAEEFYNNHKLTLAKQNSVISYDLELFKRMYESVYQRNNGRVIYAVDQEENIHSALFVVWDANSAYNMISTIDPDFRTSGSASLLVKEMIRYVSDKTQKFDFEGSMIEGVENSFRQFGAIQTPYFLITKTNSKMLIIKKILKKL